MTDTIAVLWQRGNRKGTVQVEHGALARLVVERGKGRTGAHRFSFSADGPCRLRIHVRNANVERGADATIVTVRTARDAFSFFLRDVSRAEPIFIPSLRVVVSHAADRRSYEDIERAIRSRDHLTALQKIASEPEESFVSAAEETRSLVCQTWLGLSRDLRIFTFQFREGQERWDWIQPKFHGFDVTTPETDKDALRHAFLIGRGWGCQQKLTRRLEDGVLPILRASLVDDDVTYDCTAFVTLESSPVTTKTNRGTHFLVAHGHGQGHMLTAEQKQQFEELLPRELARDEETVLCLQVKATNTSAASRYAWFSAPSHLPNQHYPPKQEMDANGFTVFPSGRVSAVHRLDGKPLRQREIAVLLRPGETCVFECYLPHRPISKQRAARLAKFDFAEKQAASRAFWQQKLRARARICVPETRIDEMVRAGLCHLDLVTYGREPRGALAATVGHFSPIGSESAPIIQFFDSMGWHDVARRSLQFFLDMQHPNGFMQNFGGYTLETGAVLWTMGEHYRYTRDDRWARAVTPKLLKACEYLFQWRKRNQRPELRGQGYGMLDGKVADPNDPFHIFMLNGYAYLGLSRVSEMLARVHPAEARRLAREANAFRADIRASLKEALARSPAVPLSDGSWCPSCPPWAERDRGTVCLYAQRASVLSHGTFFVRDSLLGPLYLVFQEVLDPREPAAEWLLQVHAELMTTRNVAFSQPYYSRHDWVHLKRGEVKAFLKTYYNAFAGLADRETYTFWEHYCSSASPHKTHEEAWFLMQTRWMLYLEEGDTLALLPAVPRAWLESGKSIRLENVASYFGPISLRVESRLDQGEIEARIECRSKRQPKAVRLRIPHPQRAPAREVVGGVYDAERESVCLRPFAGAARVVVRF